MFNSQNTILLTVEFRKKNFTKNYFSIAEVRILTLAMQTVTLIATYKQSVQVES